jgi:hypothetical protein
MFEVKPRVDMMIENPIFSRPARTTSKEKQKLRAM